MRVSGGTEVCDFLIIAGGIIGIATALELKRRFPDTEVWLIEEEPGCGWHASGRNSGVLHAGFYYSADSLKATFTKEGNRELTQFCLDRQLPLKRCGKLVVARNEPELAGLEELLRRGRANGVELESLSANEAKEIEPRVKTFDRALWSPTTSSVDPRAVLDALLCDAAGLGISVRTGVPYLGRRGSGLTFTRFPIWKILSWVCTSP